MTNKILIVGPNFQAGKCGISDYTAVLKYYLSKFQNAEVFIVSLHDRYILNLETTKESIRIPHQYTVTQRLNIFRLALQSFSPTEIVFHFVSYGYDRLGLPFWMLQLQPILKNIPCVNLIIHELWIGDHKGYNLKEKVLGYLQKRLILCFLKQYPAATCITTSAYSSNLLKKHGIKSAASRVFNNITAKPLPSVINNELKLLFQGNASCIKVVVFGSITRDAKTEDIVSFLKSLQCQYKDVIQVIGVGGLKMSAGNLWHQLESEDLEGVSFRQSGYLSNEAVSWALSKGTIGISTYPIELWTKSGAIAAMLAHGLPVVVFGNISKSNHNNEWVHYNNLYHWPNIPRDIMKVNTGFNEERLNRYNDECYNLLSTLLGWNKIL